MTEPISLDAALLVGFYTSSVLYGVFLLLFAGHLYFALSNPAARPRRTTVWLVLVSFAIFAFQTAILSISFSRVMDVFFVYVDTPNAYLGPLSRWKEIMRIALFCAYHLLADSILICRCWIICCRQVKWQLVIFPVGLWFADVAASCMVIVTVTRDNNGPVAGDLRIWTALLFGITLVQNVFVMAVLITRVQHTASDTRKFAVYPLPPAVSVMVESGALYATTVLVFFIVYLADSNVQSSMIDIVSSIIGISFSLNLVRVNLSGMGVSRVLASKPSLSRLEGSQAAATFTQSMTLPMELESGLRGLSDPKSQLEDANKGPSPHQSLTTSISSPSDPEKRLSASSGIQSRLELSRSCTCQPYTISLCPLMDGESQKASSRPHSLIAQAGLA